MFIPDILKNNGYRTLRLSCEATLSDIHESAAAIRRATTLGILEDCDSDMLQLGSVSRTDADLRTAVRRLEDPGQRLRDRLFWFHFPPRSPVPNSVSQPTLSEPVRKHELAVKRLLDAFVANFDDRGLAVRVEALRNWHNIVSDDDYWVVALSLEEPGGFELKVFPSEIEQLRERAVELAAEPLVVCGRAAVASGDRSGVRAIMSALVDLTDTGEWALIAQREIISPVVEQVRELCHKLLEELSSKVIRAGKSGERNLDICDEELTRFQDVIAPVFDQATQLFPQNLECAMELREQVALCLNRIAQDYTWADDFIAAERVNKVALLMARETLVAIRIRTELSEIHDAARQQRVLGTRKPLSSTVAHHFRALSMVTGSDLFYLVNEIEERCIAIRKNFGLKVIRKQGAADHNKLLCEAELKRFRGEIEPAFKDIVIRLASEPEGVLQAREEIAECLSAIAADHTWADDFVSCEELYEEAIELAQGTSGVGRIQELLDEVRVAASQQRRSGKPISEAPPLRTLNGLGFTLYGNSDLDPETNSYSTTHYLVAFFLPLFPLGRYRVINTSRNGYQFLGKLPLRKGDRWHRGIAAAAALAVLCYAMFASNGRAESSSHSPATVSDSSWEFNSPASVSNSSPDSKHSQLSNLKDRIESGRARHAVLETRLKPVIDEFKEENEQLRVLSTELKSLADQQKAGMEIDIDDYNTKVKTHNALLGKQRALIAGNKNNLRLYEELEKQDSLLVNQYNALLK